MPGTEPEPFGQAMEERLRRELDAIQPKFSSPRYLTHVRRPVAWRLAPAALVAALVGIVGLAAYSGSPNPAVWTQHIFSVGHQASPTPNGLAGPKSSPTPVERESPEPSESPEPHESPEPGGSPEPRESPEPSGGGESESGGSGRDGSGSGGSGESSPKPTPSSGDH